MREYEAEVVLRLQLTELKAETREDAEALAKKRFWKHMEDVSAEPELKVVLRRLT